jgi:PAS domain S-box-containing protein
MSRSHYKQNVTSSDIHIVNCVWHRSSVWFAALILAVLINILWVPLTVRAQTPAPQDTGPTDIDLPVDDQERSIQRPLQDSAAQSARHKEKVALQLKDEPVIRLTEKERTFLKAHPRIVLGSATDYPPMIISQADGTHTGLLRDLFEQISGKLNTRIDLHVEDSWFDVQEKAKNREIDGLAFGGRDPSRDALYNATDIVLNTYFSVFARSRDEYQAKRFSDIDGMRIGYKKGARPTRSLLEKLPSAILNPYDSNESLTQALLSREIDVIVAWIGYDYWRKQQLQGTVDKIYLIEEHPIEMVSYIRNDWPELVSILNKAIATLQQDEFPRIINKWFGELPQQSIADTIPLTPEEQAWLEAHPDVTFGFTDSFEPFLIRGVRGQHTGILVDLLKELNSQLGTQFALEVDSWQVILEKVKEKKMGAVLGVAHHTADAFGLSKTIPYFTVYPTFFAREDALFTIKSLDDLRGKSVAILDSAKVMEGILEPYGSDIDISRYPDNRTALQLVFEGKVDLAFGLSFHAYYINKYHLVGVKPALTLLERPSNVGMAVRTDWPELVSILNKWLTSFSEQEVDTIFRRWIDIPDREKTIELTDEEKDWLAQIRTVRVRTVDYPPYLIVKDDWPPEGIVIEYLRLIADRTGIEFKYEVTDHSFAEFLENMKGGQGPDMTALIVPTPEREQFLSFSESYIASPYVVFTREKDDPILDIRDLAGKTIAIPRGFVVQKKLSRDYPEIRQALYDSDEAALQAVAVGQADAYIGNLTVASHIIHTRGFSHMKVAAAAPFEDQTLSMGNRNDWPELTSIINKALASITREEETAIRNKYLAIKFEQGIDKSEVLKWALIIGGAAAGVIFLFVFWNARLSKETRMRKASEAQLRGFLERMPIAACLVDKQENMYYHNKRFIDSFGYKHEEIKTLSDWWPKAYPDDQYRQWVIETWSDCVRRSEEQGTDIEAKEYRVTCKDGQVREMEISGIALGDRYLATLIDNTERNRANDELTRAKEAADAANRAKSIFLASMSHEVRTPLHAILGFSRLLARDSDLKAAQQEQLDIINRSGEHLLDMVDDVLSLAKIEAGRIELKREAFDFIKLLQDVSQMMELRAKIKGLCFTVELEPGLSPYVWGDAGRLRQVMINILGNAVKYTEKGEVWLRARSQSMVTPGMALFHVEVQDTGPGIPKDRLDEVFDSFVRVENARIMEGGTGLGLAIAKTLVGIMDGEITVESEPGQGTLFKVNIPLELTAAGEATPGKALKAKVVGLQAGQPDWRILVVDDSLENRVLLTRLLTHIGCSVKEADSGEQAIKIFRQWRPHLICMDMRMPVMDGFGATRKIRTLPGAESVRIVAVTANVLEERRQDILAAGCDEIIYKPFRDQDILDAMSRLLGAKYRFEDTDFVTEQMPASGLTAEMLAGLPADLLHDLSEAALVLSMEGLGDVIERIRALAPETAQSLQVLVKEFEMARILKLLDEVRDHSEAV